MTRRAFWLIAVAYACLALGFIVTTYMFHQDQEDIEAINQRLIVAAAAYCQAGIEPDAQEKPVIDALSRGDYGKDMLLELDPICQRIVSRLERDDE